MNARRALSLPLIALLLGTFGVRAYQGIRGGWELDRGHLLRNKGIYEEAAPRLESAAVGHNTRTALLMAGEARLDLWEKQVRRRGSLGADPQELVAAGRDFLTCRCVAPAARRHWKGLGEVYDAMEWMARERRSEQGWVPREHAWAGVGHWGRVAVGMLRVALDTSPNWGRLHDRLALTLWNYGLDEDAREAVRSSARVLPIYYRHPYHEIPELPDWVAGEFAAASREVLGQVPLFPRHGHLIDLGKLERRLGANERAIAVLEEALAAGGDRLRVAEASFHLGLAQVAAERFDEGQRHLELALEHPVFRVSALRSLATLAARRGDDATAIGHLRRLRWEQPGELWPCLEFAVVAARMEDWPAAIESLRWARLKHSRDPRPVLELARIHLAMGDRNSASSMAGELERMLGEDAPECSSLRREIARGR
jgi:tetratricopeptide (TPR) repeat protein